MTSRRRIQLTTLKITSGIHTLVQLLFSGVRHYTTSLPWKAGQLAMDFPFWTAGHLPSAQRVPWISRLVLDRGTGIPDWQTSLDCKHREAVVPEPQEPYVHAIEGYW
jgi:hypothetical protein